MSVVPIPSPSTCMLVPCCSQLYSRVFLWFLNGGQNQEKEPFKSRTASILDIRECVTVPVIALDF